MKIAVVGSGASGLVTAYLLDRVHEVHVFERAPILGGNVRTLGGNVPCAKLDPGVVIENGVLGFNVARHRHVLRLLDHLGMECHQAGIGTGMFLADGRCWQVPSADATPSGRIRELLKLGRLPAEVRWPALRFLLRTGLLPKACFRDKPLSRYLGGGSTMLSAWLKAITVECYSMPFRGMADFPAAVAVPTLRMCMVHRQWRAVKDGTYAYMARLLSLIEGKVRVRSGVTTVDHEGGGVRVTLSGGETLDFDKVVFATTPEQVLRLLAQPTEGERRRFGPWKANRCKTVAHADTAFYGRWKPGQYTAGDFFETGGPGQFGYNCYQNHYRRIPPATHYSFAYSLDEFIRPETVLDVQVHTTPAYGVEAVFRRHEIIATNGENHTYHVGAYLRDGLHDGAVQSALSVSRLLGGAVI